jgi:hypothetical protein
VLEASLAHDYFDPLVWNTRNGMLVSGHLRAKVLKSLGFTDADVVVVNYDEPTHLARMIAANKGVGEDDLPRMKELFSELKELDSFDLGLSGFTDGDLAGLLDSSDTSGESPDGEEPGESSAANHVDFSAALKDLEEPHIAAALGEHWVLGGLHHLFVGSMIRPPFPWAPLLTGSAVSEAAADGRETRFIPCPDLTVALTNKKVRLVMVSPAALTASYLLSVYAKIHGDSTVVRQTP